MKKTFVAVSLTLLTLSQIVSCLHAQEMDGSELQRYVDQRNERVAHLSLDEQLKLRAAQTKAAEDPEVQAAMKKRNEAIEAFRAALRASMVKSNPEMKAIIEKITPPSAPAKP